MKTTAKWLDGDQFILENNQHFRLAMVDPESSEKMTPSCLDLMLMGFTGSITCAFRTRARQQSIPYREIDTEVIVEFNKPEDGNMFMQVHLHTFSGAPGELLKDCLNQAIKSSIPGVLLQRAGIKITPKVTIHMPLDSIYF